MQPHEYSRRILLAVTGLSPQVVTETVYALAVSEPPFVPTEIHLLTTREGAQRARLALLSDDPGWFHRLRSDYALPPIAFDAGHIHVLAGADGAPLDDIRTEEDNLATADAITEHVRRVTQDPASSVHVSIAGGRKTMGFYLGYALSLFGRAQDRLSHVLVSEPFESTWDFFYPTPTSRVIQVKDNKLADARDATVTLATIPFVSLRAELPRALLDGRAGFAQTVAAASAALGAPQLVLDAPSRRVCMGGNVFDLPPAEFAFLAALAHRARSGKPALRAPKKDVVDREWARAYLADVQAACGIGHVPHSLDRLCERGVDSDYVSQRLSRLNKILQTQLDVGAARYRIDGGRGRGYRLRLPPEAIRFERLPYAAGGGANATLRRRTKERLPQTKHSKANIG
jgi:CRISPR-associated protein (TIGR02584 family)